MLFHEFLKKRIKHLGITQASVVEYTGVDRSNFNTTLNHGRPLKDDYLPSMAEILKVTPKDLAYFYTLKKIPDELAEQYLSDEPPIPNAKPVTTEAPDGLYKVRKFLNPTACGSGGIAEETPDGYEYLKSLPKYVKKPELVYCTVARGDSMEPAIFDGDLLFVYADPDKRLHDGDFVISTNSDGECTCKVYRKKNNKYYLEALNPDTQGYPCELLDKTHTFKVFKIEGDR